MIGSNAFNYINVLNKAADASWVRNEVISNNIANVDTPGYKRKDVQFESYLRSALLGDNSLEKRVSDAHLDSLNPSIYTDNISLSYRLDGNNVNIDTESANLAQNQVRYYSLIDSMSQEFGRLKTVLQAK
ncbi:MAG: flagellar basal body rod protein FlgB [Lachnospiraceae bacterium]|jgi:flagellar basal-body rod protein FlgB|nr:flagellar basal body rod protein FlgB [Lachnospiraceae bacterium]